MFTITSVVKVSYICQNLYLCPLNMSLFYANYALIKKLSRLSLFHILKRNKRSLRLEEKYFWCTLVYHLLVSSWPIIFSIYGASTGYVVIINISNK